MSNLHPSSKEAYFGAKNILKNMEAVYIDLLIFLPPKDMGQKHLLNLLFSPIIQ